MADQRIDWHTATPTAAAALVMAEQQIGSFVLVGYLGDKPRRSGRGGCQLAHTYVRPRVITVNTPSPRGLIYCFIYGSDTEIQFTLEDTDRE